jgi:WD40 repeat protein
VILFTLVTVIGVGVILPKKNQPAPEAPANPQAALNVDRFGDPLPAGAVARLGTVRFRSDTWAQEIAVSPDRKTLAVVGWNSVLLWDAQTGRELRRYGPAPKRRVGDTGYSMQFASVAFSPDGATLAAGTSDSSGEPCPVWLFDVATGKKVGELPGHSQGTHFLAFLSDGRSVVTAGSNGVPVHEVGVGRELRRLAWAGKSVSNMAVSADRRYVFLAGPARKGENPPGLWEVWDAGAGQLVHRAGLPSAWLGASFSPDGAIVAICVSVRSPDEPGPKSEIRLWDLAAKKEVRRWPGPGGPNGHMRPIAFSPDGQFVATGGADHVVRQWSVTTGKEERPNIHPYRHAATVAYLDAATLLTYGAQNSVRIWDAATGKPVRRFDGGEAHIDVLAVSPDGRTVATAGGGGDATVRLWEVATGRQRLHITGAMYDVTGLAFSPDGKLIAGADSHGVVTLWDTTAAIIQREFKGHKGWATVVVFSPDGRTIATGDHGNTVRLWDVHTGNEGRKMTGTNPMAHVAALVFSPDGQTLFSAGSDHAIRQWDVASGKAVRVMQGTQGPNGPDDSFGHTSVVSSLALSRDGRRLVSGSYDHTIRVWETATGRTCRIVKSSNRTLNSAVRTVALSPDGSLLAAASEEDGRRNLIDVWDLNSRRQLAPLSGHTGQVTVLAFTPEGRRLASVSTDTTGLLWDVEAIRANAPAVDAAGLATLWADLAGEPGPAYDAVRRGIAAGDRTVELLREQLKPAPTVDSKRVAELLTALGSARFAERDRASRDLAALGSAIEGELRKALTEDRPAEVKARVKVLLTELGAGELQTVRAVEILEGIGTPAAKKVLAELAAGATGAKLTRDASASLGRLR